MNNKNCKRKYKKMWSNSNDRPISGFNKKKKFEEKISKKQNHTDNSVENSKNETLQSKKDTKFFKVSLPLSTNNATYLSKHEKHDKELRTENRNQNNEITKSAGSNNWQKFLLDQGKQYVLNRNPLETVQKSKPKSCNSSRDKSTKVIGMDCEMVGIGVHGKDNMLARVSIVNIFGDCLYDKFVKPNEQVTDYRTHISGVRPSDLIHGEEFQIVQKEVAGILKGKILVGHAIKNDLEVLFLTHPRPLTRDTAKFFRKKGCSTPSLKNLAAEHLDVEIQAGEHSSVQDAQAAVQLYNMFRKQWETGGGNRKTNRIDTATYS